MLYVCHTTSIANTSEKDFDAIIILVVATGAVRIFCLKCYGREQGIQGQVCTQYVGTLNNYNRSKISLMALNVLIHTRDDGRCARSKQHMLVFSAWNQIQVSQMYGFPSTQEEQ